MDTNRYNDCNKVLKLYNSTILRNWNHISITIKDIENSIKSCDYTKQNKIFSRYQTFHY